MDVATVTAVLLLICYIHSRMQTSILFKVPGKPSTSPLVILTGPALGAQCSTPISVRLTRALTAAWQRARSICTPVHIVTFASAAAALFAFAGFICDNETLLCTASAANVACIFFLEPMVRKGGEK